MEEAKIIINDNLLCDAQSATVRMALIQFSISLQDKDFREALGPIGLAYQARLKEIFVLMSEDKSR